MAGFCCTNIMGQGTVVWLKFVGGNFHVKKISVKIFLSSWVLDKNFLIVNNYLDESFATAKSCVNNSYKDYA